MKNILFLLPFVGLALGAELCQCPQVKCPGEPASALCLCKNSAETKCKERCPDYVPTILPCPISPPTLTKKTLEPTKTTAKPTPTPTCTCEPVFCAQVFPQSCVCANNNKKRCWEKCGGPKPELEVCPDPTLEPTPPPTKTPTRKRCGGGRGNQHLVCDEDEVCIAEPGTCGPPCDGFGVCVKDKLCGGIAGFGCPTGQSCIDDPRDDCDPKHGGADCGGLCY
jgi:hypothetical protein